MTQHTQPVVAAQYQHPQQQQQALNTQQQQQSTTTSNTNNNVSNNNSSTSTPTTTIPTTNNNQTQTVTVHQQQTQPHHQNNNGNYQSQQQQQNAAGGQIFNPQLQSVFVPAHGMSAAVHHHHHPQHHHQAGAMYQTMIPAAIPSNVYVNNVTANVNLHGWSHTVPHGAWVHPGGGPHYLHGDLPPEQGAPVIQPMGAMPVTMPAPNALTGPIINPNASTISAGTRGSRRGRGRGGTSVSRRGEYSMQRHPQPEGSPAPQQTGQNNQQDVQQQQQGQQQSADAQQIMNTLPATYVPHPQYAAHAPQYPYGYPTYFAPQQHLLHPSPSSAAQQATGTPLCYAMPVYNGPHMYNYGYYLPPVINQSEYQYGEEVGAGGGLGDERQAASEGGTMMWHQQPIYTDEYGMSPVDMHGVSSDDHNSSSIGSANETPNLLSPNYPPMYEHMTQQMGVMQIYDDPQMGQMQVIHPQTGVPLMEEELSECSSQTSAPLQMMSPIQMVPTTVAAPPMSLPAATNEHILHQQTPHLIPVTGGGGGGIISIEATTPQQLQHIPLQQQSITGDNTTESTVQSYENVSNIRPVESVVSLNDEIVQQSADNLAIDYQQRMPQQQSNQQQQQQEIQTQNVLLQAEQTENYNNNNKILMTDVQEMQECVQKATKVTVAAATACTDMTVETIASNKQLYHQQQPVYQQQQSQEKHHKQQQQYVVKPMVPQQQQYQHQQLQTQQPMPEQLEQQQAGQQQAAQPTHQPQQQPQQETHYHQQQQHQHHQPQQQPYENRKSSQMYNQQHQSRGRKYDYHHGHNMTSGSNETSSHQQQSTKSMSWTNSTQYKKSTNTVAVTATPASSHTSGSYNKQSNTANASVSHTHGTRTYTNQQHHNYQQQQQQQQQNYQHYQQQHQPQTRNYGAMKMPSSPIASAPNTMERKTNQSSEAGKGHTQQQQQQSTSTASTTAAPHQFQQQQQSQQTSTNDPQTSSTSTVNAVAATSPISPKQSPQQQHYPPGFATKKHSPSNQGHGGTNTTTHNPTATSNSHAMETSNTPTINLAPPVSNTTPAAPSTPSWASLFASSSNVSNSGPSNSSANNINTTSSSLSSATAIAYSKKPIAKVAPYEGITPVTPPLPIVTPGTLSYSAASAQNISPPSQATNATAAKRASCGEQKSQRTSLANLDEFSLKFAEFLTKYKSDWATISLRPRGLTNRSNYCYINSILQALLGCSPLYNLIRSIPKQAANLCEVKTPTVNAMITFISNFSNLPGGLRLRNTKGGKGNKDDLGGDLQCDPAFEPTEIYKLWNDSREEYVEGRQEDAEEFLSYILNKLNDEMLEVIKLIAKPITEQSERSVPQEEDGDVWQMICNNRNKGSVTRQTDFGCTPLSDIFRGELRSRLQREGELSTDVIQPFFTLQLNIEKAASVKEALEILVGRDQLEGVTGSKSKQEVVAWQQMNLEKLPPILILHLKWFDYRSDGCTKILKKVEFPVELKIDAKILASKKYSQKQRAYRLFAVVYHDGKEATKGHYITDVYHTGYGSWLRYDDSSVKPVSENHVLLPRTPRVPYLLCYRRCDTIPQQGNNNQNNYSAGNNNSSANTQSSSGK